MTALHRAQILPEPEQHEALAEIAQRRGTECLRPSTRDHLPAPGRKGHGRQIADLLAGH